MLSVWVALGWGVYAMLGPIVPDREPACLSKCAETASNYRYRPPTLKQPWETCECEKPSNVR